MKMDSETPAAKVDDAREQLAAVMRDPESPRAGWLPDTNVYNHRLPAPQFICLHQPFNVRRDGVSWYRWQGWTDLGLRARAA